MQDVQDYCSLIDHIDTQSGKCNLQTLVQK